MRRLDRYILAEILGPLGLGFLVYTLILLLQFLFRSAEMIIRRGVPPETVGRLVLVYLPSIVVLTIPMAMLFGILIAVGRLSSDSELVALRASGISLFSLYRPILVISALLTACNIWLTLEVLPQGNQALQQLRVEILRTSLSEQIEPRTFYHGWKDKALYVFETVPGDRRWRGVFLADAIPSPTHSDVLVAEWGEARTSGNGEEVFLALENAYQHSMDFSQPVTYNIYHHDLFQQLLPASERDLAEGAMSRSARELDLVELRRRAHDHALSAPERNLARVEIHKRFAIPAACLALGLLGLPLGFTNARGGRSSGFALSMAVILVYYILLNWGEEIAREGDVQPWVAVWLPNLALVGLGLLLLGRRNRDKSLVMTRFASWVQAHLWGRVVTVQQRRQTRKLARRRAATEARRQRADVVVRLPMVRLTLLSTIDRYVLGLFLRVLVLAAFSGVVVYVAADLTDKIDEILELHIARHVVFAYYQYRIFSILYEIAPVVVLATTLVTFGLLSRRNEITAFKGLGTSLYRLALPVLLAAAGVAAGAGLLESEILPAANERANELEAVIRGQSNEQAYLRADRRWLFGRGGYLYNYLYYDAQEETLHRLQVFKFDAQHRLTDRLLVDRASYLGDGWWNLSQGWARSFAGKEVTRFRTIGAATKDRLPERPGFFVGELRKPGEMTYGDLEEYIEELKTSGQEVPALEVQLHNKIAYPVNSLVMVLVALPFAFRLGRRGALYGIGLSLALGIVFLVLLATFKALGEAGALPPAAAVWSPGTIFGIFSLYLFLGVRS